LKAFPWNCHGVFPSEALRILELIYSFAERTCIQSSGPLYEMNCGPIREAGLRSSGYVLRISFHDEIFSPARATFVVDFLLYALGLT
jgi:hypothetical protein